MHHQLQPPDTATDRQPLADLPSNTAAAAAGHGSADACDGELERLYATHAPAKLLDLPALKAKYGPALLLAKARAKYEGRPAVESVHGQDTAAAAAREEAKLSTLLAAGAARRRVTRPLLATATLADQPDDPLYAVRDPASKDATRRAAIICAQGTARV
jgi:hypothetical protein